MFTAGDGGNGHKIGNKRREKGATKDRVEKNIRGKKKRLESSQSTQLLGIQYLAFLPHRVSRD